MIKHTLHVKVPANWYEVENTSPRAYRRRSASSGWVHVSLFPPEPDLNEDGDKTLVKLRHLLVELGPEIGKELAAHHSPCTAGLVATCMYQSPKRGLLQFWLIPTDALVFVTYTMGDLHCVKEDLKDAHEIVAGMHFEAVEY